MHKQEKLYDLLDTLRTGVEAAGTLALGTLGLACEGYFPLGSSSSRGTTKGFRALALRAREESNIKSAFSL